MDEISDLLILFVVIGICGYSVYFLKKKKLVEGMNDGGGDETSNTFLLSKAGDKVADHTTELNLNLKQNKEHYKKIIEKLDTHVAHVQLRFLNRITKTVATNPDDQKTLEEIKKLNTLSEFRRTLLHQMNYLDN